MYEASYNSITNHKSPTATATGELIKDSLDASRARYYTRLDSPLGPTHVPFADHACPAVIIYRPHVPPTTYNNPNTATMVHSNLLRSSLRAGCALRPATMMCPRIGIRRLTQTPKLQVKILAVLYDVSSPISDCTDRALTYPPGRRTRQTGPRTSGSL